MLRHNKLKHPHSFAVKQAEGQAAVRALSRRFAESINAGRVSKVGSR
jgi:hypothetical protein